jgi:hypothetical protein
MNRIYSGHWITVLLIVLVGCASSPPLVPVTNSNDRLQFNGFSLLPPQGAGWNWVGREDQDKIKIYDTTFVKMDGDRTYVARAQLLDSQERDLSNPQDLLEFVRGSDIVKELPGEQNKVSTVVLEETLGRPCARYDFDAEGYSGVSGKGNTVFSLDAHGLICTHPKTDTALAWIAYTRRSPKGESYLAGREEGEAFLASVKFTEVR